MLFRDVRIAVVGAGAIGGVTAAFLKIGGWNPQLVCKHQQIVDQARAEGLKISGIRGNHTVKLEAVKDISDFTASLDLVFLATKGTDCLQAAEALLPCLKKDAVVVSLQNGICEDDLGTVLGRERVMGCVVGWGASMTGPGRLEVTSKGEFVIGNIDNLKDENLPFVRKMLDARCGSAHLHIRKHHGRVVCQADYQFLHQFPGSHYRTAPGRLAG